MLLINIFLGSSTVEELRQRLQEELKTSLQHDENLCRLFDDDKKDGSFSGNTTSNTLTRTSSFGSITAELDSSRGLNEKIQSLMTRVNKEGAQVSINIYFIPIYHWMEMC